MADTPIAALIEAVEAGADWISTLADAAFANKEHAVLACRAYGYQGQPGTQGSLDAAEALHDTLLPEWALERLTMWPGPNGSCNTHLWGTHDDKGERWHSAKDGRVEASAATPARAWLLSILRAHQSQQETGQ